MENLRGAASRAAECLLDAAGFAPKVCVVLGSGWGAFADRIEGAKSLPYARVPGFPLPTVKGHDGRWVFGHLRSVPVAVMCGRFHRYEGHDLSVVTLPVRAMRAMGAQAAFFTNAAGGVNTSFEVGDLMAITDHICMTGENPLFGPNDEALGPRFPDMSRAYDRELLAVMRGAADKLSFRLREGVYAQMPGPSFETPAEIRMLRVLGADAVGMSTVPEVIAARHGGLRVAALSCITNMAAGVLDQPLSHDEVVAAGRNAAGRIGDFLTEAVAGAGALA
ncbi:MAG: purine-nucleoside phosphorylase [Clostridiales bacterium]|nr:purine-nucleoside phosphorylase [Clostridiales bacterium]